MFKRFNKVDREFKKVWNAIENLIIPVEDEPKDPIGFKSEGE